MSFNWSWTNGFELIFIHVELIQIECSKCIRSIWTKTNANLLHSNLINSISHKKLDDCVNRTRGRNSSTSICPVDWVSCPDTEIQVFPECKFPWTRFHVLTWRWNPVHGNSHSGKTWIFVSGHETWSTGVCQNSNSLWTWFHVLTRRSELFYHKCEWM